MGVSGEVSQSEMLEINRSFREFDQDKNGYITRDEVKECLKKANVRALDAIVDHTLKEMDHSGDGRVSYAEYLKFMTAVYLGEHSDLKRQ
ncbi:unnamed protein product [Didymodactylos carnosus]|uniref:EF-hand domain-containing protein n=1 Tax=Didymodactylos carnosus TaxID=1234261 RepID=A0A815EST0_9BILA|nr:unnamed protein product [Didymodactylos carnosus]CAF1315642.1 unnamed protein product [Didymodactylos carnosus]CAF3812663.1 unnamed protein product [Didymodactylos carnosus]CAF4157324.1 unnamed protein product [Didymodactylos carnosus]